MQAGDLVDDEGEKSGHEESPSGGRGNVCDLLGELDPFVLDPAAGVETSVDAIEADNVGRSENAVEEKADHTSDAVLSENIHSVVDADPEFDCFR